VSADAAAVMRRFLDDVWNAHDLDAFPAHVSRAVRFHPPRGPSRDYEGYLEMARDFLRAFPDLRFTVDRVTADGDVASARLLIEGTNEGPFRGRSPTRRRIRVVGQPQCRVEHGRIVEFWQLFDELGMLHQLGHVQDASLLAGHAAPP
jgi:predicted ester cyclase